jgi:prepilin-type processing-associated H-X9-DG protein
LEGDDTGSSFAYAEEFDRLTAGFGGPVGSLLYLDVRSFMPLAARSLNGFLPGLSEALQFENVDSVAIMTGRQRDLSPEVRVAIGAKRIDAGLWHLIAQTPPRSPLPKGGKEGSPLVEVFPPQTTFVIRGSMERASSLVEDVFAIAEIIDPRIAEEYEEERADFKSEIGLDPHTDLLGNLVEAWAFGGRLVPEGIRDRMFAVRIEEVTAFESRMNTLRAMFQLEITSHDYRGVIVNRADRTQLDGPLSYAIIDDVLLVARQEQTLAQAIDAVLDERSLGHRDLFSRVYKRRGSASPHGASYFTYLDLGQTVFAEWKPDDLAELPPDLRGLAASESAVSLSVVPYERMVAFDLVSTAEADRPVRGILSKMVAESLKQARVQSARIRSIVSVNGLLISCKIYANGHKNRWPESLTQLSGDGSITREMLSSPYPDTATSNRDATVREHNSSAPASDRSPYYLYRHIADPASVKEPATQVVISEPEIHDGGAVFGFFDGHVEWVTSPRAEDLLAIMRRR